MGYSMLDGIILVNFNIEQLKCDLLVLNLPKDVLIDKKLCTPSFDISFLHAPSHESASS